MNNNLKTIASALILMLGLFFFLISIANRNFNFVLISITLTLILWVLYNILINNFNLYYFSLIVSITGFLTSIAIFIIFGIEEVPFPIGAIIFHSEGIAGALSIFFISLFPILFINNNIKNSKSIINNNKENNTSEKLQLDNDDWEIASNEDLHDYEIT